METFVNILKVIHIITAVLMAWPFYALVGVNQRARLGPPLGDRTDTYLENLIKNRTVPCFVFQATALVSGLILVFLRGLGVSYLLANPALLIKLLLLLTIASLLTYVHTSLQPEIDSLFTNLRSSSSSQETSKKIAALRLRRKRMASICLFCVLTATMLGVLVWLPFQFWLTALLVIAIALFVWRAYSSVIPYGWV